MPRNPKTEAAPKTAKPAAQPRPKTKPHNRGGGITTNKPPPKKTAPPTVDERLNTIFDRITEELLVTLETNYNSKGG